MFDLDAKTPRRSFFGRLAAASVPVFGLKLFGASPLEAQAPTRAVGPGTPWLDAMKGKHKTTFDVDTHKNGNALVQAKSFRDAWRDAFGVPEQDVNLVMAVRGTGIPIVLRDDVWAKYRIGEQYGITDPSTKAPAVRNVFIAANLQPGGPVNAEQTVEALQHRDILFLICNNTIAGATRKLVAAGMGTTEQVRSTIAGGMLPGVITVPAMVVAFTQMQERGFAYVYAG